MAREKKTLFPNAPGADAGSILMSIWRLENWEPFSPGKKASRVYAALFSPPRVVLNPRMTFIEPEAALPLASMAASNAVAGVADPNSNRHWPSSLGLLNRLI